MTSDEKLLRAMSMAAKVWPRAVLMLRFSGDEVVGVWDMRDAQYLIQTRSLEQLENALVAMLHGSHLAPLVERMRRASERIEEELLRLKTTLDSVLDGRPPLGDARLVELRRRALIAQSDESEPTASIALAPSGVDLALALDPSTVLALLDMVAERQSA